MLQMDIPSVYVDAVKKLREKRPDVTIVVGNVVVSLDMTQELILAGADM